MSYDVIPSINFERALDHYDPEHGLKRIAVAEAAETHWARARDAEKLFAAVEAKLTEQRRFVRWYDLQPKNRGGGDGSNQYQRATSHRTVTGSLLDLATLFGLDPNDQKGIHAIVVMLSRWRKALKDPAPFRDALDDARHRVLRICEQQQIGTVRGTEGTGEFELYTPAQYIEAARSVLGAIDLDPASNELAQQTVRATHYFTHEIDGLVREWHGRVWLNPPYHRDLLPRFVGKLVDEIEAGHTTAAIMLTNNCTDTHWFLRAASAAQAICFTTGRIRFLQSGLREIAPTQGQAFLYFGADRDRFADVFGDIGFGVVPWWWNDRP